MNWHYQSGDNHKGPVSDTELDALIASGAVTPSTLVWRQGMGDWLPLSAARPSPISLAGGPPPMGEAHAGAEGAVKCDSCGRFVFPHDVLQISGRNVCSQCKPTVMQSISQSGDLSIFNNDERTGPAWERRKEIGTFPAIWQTAKGVLFEPAATFLNMKREGGLGTPLAYYAITGIAAAEVSIAYQWAAAAFFHAKGIGATGPFPFPGAEMLTFPVWMFCVPFFLILSLFMSTGIYHLALKISRGASQPFETTFRAYAYAGGSAALLQFIPVAGPFLAGIWALVAMVIGLAKAHDTTVGRVILSWFILICASCLFFGAIAFAVAASVGGLKQH